MRDLNPESPQNERKLARQILQQHRSPELRTTLEYYLAANEYSYESKSLAAEVIVQMVESQDGDDGLIQLSKRASSILVRHANARMIERLASYHSRELPRIFAIISSADKRNFIKSFLAQSKTDRSNTLAIAISNFVSLSDALLVIEALKRNDPARRVGALSIARLAEKEEGELGLARIIIRSDIDEDLRQPSILRVREILSGISARFTKLKNLENEEKSKLVSEILDHSSPNEIQETSNLLFQLDSNHDLEVILRSYVSSKIGLLVAAKTIVRLNTDGRSDNLTDRALIHLLQDSSPYIQREAAEKIKHRISKSNQLSSVYRLLDPLTKQQILRSVLNSIASQDRELLSPSIRKLFRDASASGVALNQD